MPISTPRYRPFSDLRLDQRVDLRVKGAAPTEEPHFANARAADLFETGAGWSGNFDVPGYGFVRGITEIQYDAWDVESEGQ